MQKSTFLLRSRGWLIEIGSPIEVAGFGVLRERKIEITGVSMNRI